MTRSLLPAIIVLIAAYLLQGYSPWLAGAVAVIPVKILATAWITWKTDPRTLHAAIEGMLVWQCIWAVGLAVVWRWTR